MKRIICLLTIPLYLGIQISYGQVTVEVSGTVKSLQGAVQGAEIIFLTVNDEFQGNCISGPDGRFKSQYKFQPGKTIKVRITGGGYETYEKTIQVDKSGNAGEFMLERKKLTISGFVKDSISETALDGAKIFFYDESSRVIQSRSTNSLGYFDFETNFTFGQKITVRVSKDTYHDKEQTLTFTSDGRNTIQDILLPHIGDRGLRAFITIKDKKKGKPLAGANIHYLDRRRSAYIDTVVGPNGKVELKLYQRPGTILDMEISRPNYRTIRAQPTLSEDPLSNGYEYMLERDKRSSLGPVLLIGGGVAALASGGLYLSSNSKYNSYKDFSNVNRESDYNAAQSSRNISVAAAGVAGCALIAYIIYKVKQKNKEKDIERGKIKKSFGHFAPMHESYATGNTHIIGITYQF